MSNRMILNETSYFGRGAIESIVPEFQQRGFGKAAVITDRGLTEHGIVTKVTELLDKTAIAYVLYNGIVPNPTIQNVKDRVAFVREAEADCLITIDEGSPVDTAKAIGIILTNPEFSDVISLEGVADTKDPCLPILAIPTTSRTTAEVTINYVITDEVNHRKFVRVDPHDIPIVTFIDSDMVMGVPEKLAASTDMDAVTHTIEGSVTKGAWEVTDMPHLKAIEITGHSLEASVDSDQNGREKMALGQYVAGMGFSNVGLGLVHGMVHPLNAWYNIPHGVACAALLPTAMKYNKEYTGEEYHEIALVLGVKGTAGVSLEDVREAACGEIDRLSKAVGILETISELGVKKADIPAITEDTLRDICTPGDPRETTVEEIIALYQSLM